MNKEIKFPESKEIFIVPSILSANFSNLKKEILSVEKYAGWIQVDIMDGHFVPNLSFGPHITKNLREITKLPIDVHLMVENPFDYIDPFYKAGADLITCHIEANDFFKTIKKVRKIGLKAGLALRPKTKIKEVERYLKDIDLLLIMGVNPGFGGQEFIPSVYEKIKLAYKIKKEKNLNYHIQIDGGVNEKTIFSCIESGANSLVMGSALFSKKNPDYIKKLKKDLSQKGKINV